MLKSITEGTAEKDDVPILFSFLLAGQICIEIRHY